MPEHIRALIVIVVLASAVFWFARKLVCEHAFTEADFRFRRNAWFACVLVIFLSNDFWLYIIVSGLLLVVLAKRDRNPFALFCFLLLALPVYSLLVPGVGPIDNLFEINFARLLSIAVLLPLALRVRKEGFSAHYTSRFPDICVALYILLEFVLNLRAYPVTECVRFAFTTILDWGLPYYVASRAITSIHAFREVVAAFVLSAAVLAPIAIFESLQFWHLYDGLRPALGLPAADFTTYITRGDAGLLRASATFGSPIILGYVMMMAVALFPFASANSGSPTMRKLSLLTLLGASIASLSRGPWLALMGVIAAVVGLGPGRSKRIGWSMLILSIAVVFLFVTPFGAAYIEYLPFVGGIEAGNIDYRVELWQVSMRVYELNPWFGDVKFIENPALEVMRQGQDIIDVTNNYLQVLLAHGLVGCVFYFTPFLYALRVARKLQKRAIAANDMDIERLARCLIACIFGVMITIATASDIGVIPTLYGVLIGLTVGAHRSLNPMPATDTSSDSPQTMVYARGSRAENPS